MSTAWAAAKANYGRYMTTLLAAIVICVCGHLCDCAGFVRCDRRLHIFSRGQLLRRFRGLRIPYGACGHDARAGCDGSADFSIHSASALSSLFPEWNFPAASRRCFGLSVIFSVGISGRIWGHTLIIGLITVGIELVVIPPFYVPLSFNCFGPGRDAFGHYVCKLRH